FRVAPPTEFSPLSLHDALPIYLDTVAGELPVGFDGERFRGRGAIDAKGPAVALLAGVRAARRRSPALGRDTGVLIQAVSGEEGRSEEHTSELQSRENLVCRLLL